MVAILNLAILDSAIFVFPFKVTHTCQDWLPPISQNISLIHSHLTWWWQPSWILPSWIWPSCFLPSYYFLSNLLTLAKIGSHPLHKRTSLIHSDSTWWWQASWILSCWIQTLPSWIQTPCYLLSDSLKNPPTPLWLWLKLIQSDSNSFILSLLDDGSHLEFCHLEFGHLAISHLSISSHSHSQLPRLVPTISTKETSLFHPDST